MHGTAVNPLGVLQRLSAGQVPGGLIVVVLVEGVLGVLVESVGGVDENVEITDVLSVAVEVISVAVVELSVTPGDCGVESGTVDDCVVESGTVDDCGVESGTVDDCGVESGTVVETDTVVVLLAGRSIFE